MSDTASETIGAGDIVRDPYRRFLVRSVGEGIARVSPERKDGMWSKRQQIERLDRLRIERKASV